MSSSISPFDRIEASAPQTVRKVLHTICEPGDVCGRSQSYAVNLRKASVHYDVRTFTMRGDTPCLWTMTGRVDVTLRPGDHQKRLLAWGMPKEAELVVRKGRMYFNLVLEKEITFKPTGPVVDLDVGENNLAATDTGRIWGGGELRHDRPRLIRVAPRNSPSGGGRCRPPQCSGPADVVHHVSL